MLKMRLVEFILHIVYHMGAPGGGYNVQNDQEEEEIFKKKCVFPFDQWTNKRYCRYLFNPYNKYQVKTCEVMDSISKVFKIDTIKSISLKKYQYQSDSWYEIKG